MLLATPNSREAFLFPCTSVKIIILHVSLTQYCTRRNMCNEDVADIPNVLYKYWRLITDTRNNESQWLSTSFLIANLDKFVAVYQCFPASKNAYIFETSHIHNAHFDYNVAVLYIMRTPDLKTRTFEKSAYYIHEYTVIMQCYCNIKPKKLILSFWWVCPSGMIPLI